MNVYKLVLITVHQDIQMERVYVIKEEVIKYVILYLNVLIIVVLAIPLLFLID